MASPLHQFEIHRIVPIHVGGYDLSFTNSSLFMMLALVVATVLMTVPMRRATTVPGRWQSLPEMLYEFVSGLVRDIVGPGGMRFVPMVFTLFMIVLLGNFLGMVPFGFTFTSHIIVTVALGVFVMGFVIIAGIINHGLHFFSIFAPAGLPFFIYPILVPIEIISFLSRAFSLAIRLGANMIAGHTVLKVIALFSVQMGVVFGLLPMVFNIPLIALELMIASLQAYIFTVLTCMYLKDAVELHH